jgi:hypothetical protein
MGFNRRKMEDQRRQASEKEAAAPRRAEDRSGNHVRLLSVSDKGRARPYFRLRRI